MNNIITKLKRALTDEEIRFSYMTKMGLFDHMSDERYLKKKYKSCMGVDLDLENPKTFNEKLQWLKLHDRRPEYTMMVDKYLVRAYIAEQIGEEHLIPLLGVWDDPDEIDFEKLPDQFVLKCNHNSGTGMCICKDKQKLDVEQTKKELRKGLQENYYLMGREWPYKDVPRKIICEKYMVDSKTKELRDYKLFCFGGNVMFFKVDFGRFTEHHANYYDREGNLLSIGEADFSPIPEKSIEIPRNIEIMIELAEKLSKGIPFLRVDFYDVNGNVYFGEITFYPASGFGKFTLLSDDIKLGNYIDICHKWDNEK